MIHLKVNEKEKLWRLFHVIEDVFYVPIGWNFTQVGTLSAKFSINLITGSHRVPRDIPCWILQRRRVARRHCRSPTSTTLRISSPLSLTSVILINGIKVAQRWALYLRPALATDASWPGVRTVEAIAFSWATPPGTGANSAGQLELSMYGFDDYGGTAIFTLTADLEGGDTFNVNAFEIFTGHHDHP